MTRAVGRIIAASIFALAATAPVVLGQDKPVSLVPAAPEAATDAPTGGAAGEPLPPAAGELGSDSQPKQGIEVDALGGSDPDGLGILPPGESGFGPDLWDGGRRDTLIALLARVEGALASPVLRGLLERMLLTTATAPVATDGRAGDFLAARVGALLTLGRPEKVLDLLARIPRAHQIEATMRGRVEALLVRGLYDDACRIVRQEIVAYHAETFWAQALIFCQIHADEIDQAMLGLDLLRETGSEDQLFASLAFRFAGGEADEAPVARAGALHLAMMRLMDESVPEDFVNMAPAYLWTGLVVGAKLGTEAKLDLAERAAAAGVMPGDLLAAAYAGTTLSAEERAAALAVEPARGGPRERASLFQAAESSQLDIAKAEALGRLLKSGRIAGRYEAVLAATLPLLESLEPRVDLAWFAETPARAFIHIGQFERARSWLRLAERAAETNAGDLRPMLHLRGAAPESSVSFPDLVNARDPAIPTTAGEEAPALDDSSRSALTVLAALEAVLETAPGEWSDLIADSGLLAPASADGILILALRNAAEEGRLGEGLLLIAALIGERGLAELSIIEVNAALRGLVDFGLIEEARLVGAEIALAHGY